MRNRADKAGGRGSSSLMMRNQSEQRAFRQLEQCEQTVE